MVEKSYSGLGWKELKKIISFQPSNQSRPIAASLFYIVLNEDGILLNVDGNKKPCLCNKLNEILSNFNS